MASAEPGPIALRALLLAAFVVLGGCCLFPSRSRFVLDLLPGTLSISASTGEKPQSKLWRHEAFWWAVLPDSSGTWIWRLDAEAWTRVLRLSRGTGVRADCRSDGAVTHVLLFDGVATRLASVEFFSGSPGGYRLWSRRPSLVDVPLSEGVETATLDIDSTDRMWIASDGAEDIEVRYSDPPYTSWHGPVILETGVSADDICALVALPDGTVGVLWSNQQTRRFGFRVHVDRADPAQWSEDELPSAESALDAGLGMADDHLNVAVAPDGTLYAAVKTSYDTIGLTRIALLVRRPDGMWDPLHEVDTEGTRPIVLLDERRDGLIVAYTRWEGFHDIVYRESPASSIRFGPRRGLLAGSLNDVTSTKQNITDDVVLLASGGPVTAPDASRPAVTAIRRRYRRPVSAARSR